MVETSWDLDRMNRKVFSADMPKLRFPEFRDTSKWEKRDIASICTNIFSGGTPAVGNSQYYGSDIPFIRSAEIDKEKTEFSITNSGLENSSAKIVNKDDVLVALRGANPGEVALAKIEGAISHTVVCFQSQYSNAFIYYYLAFGKKQIISACAQGSRGYLSEQALKSIILLMPTDHEEQRKITACLSSIDELIAVEQQKLNILKAQKNGFMKNLFPVNGEVRPKLRFPEFRSASNWEVRRFDDLYHLMGTNSLSRDKLTRKEGSVKNIHYSDIHMKFSSHFNIGEEDVPYIADEGFLENCMSADFCKEGDLVFADVSEGMSGIGKCIEIVCLHNEKILSGRHTILARKNDESLVLGFAGYLFQSCRHRDQIRKKAQGASNLSISGDRLSEIEVCFPKDKKEQRRITDYLSFVDDLIAAQTRKIHLLDDHKGGLMQKILPAVGGIAK